MSILAVRKHGRDKNLIGSRKSNFGERAEGKKTMHFGSMIIEKG